jgi:Fe-S oxidoreductase
VVTGNPGCHLQIERGLRDAGATVEVVHPVTLLWRSSGAADAVPPESG